MIKRTKLTLTKYFFLFVPKSTHKMRFRLKKNRLQISCLFAKKIRSPLPKPGRTRWGWPQKGRLWHRRSNGSTSSSPTARTSPNRYGHCAIFSLEANRKRGWGQLGVFTILTLFLAASLVAQKPSGKRVFPDFSTSPTNISLLTTAL